jgi:carboxyl-terminal processing protease
MDMRSFRCRVRAAIYATALIVCSWSVQYSQAQVEIPTSAFSEQREIAEFLARGEEMESAGRWGEAYQFYLREGRQFENSVKVKNRMAMARIRYDLDRRYADASYVQAIDQRHPQIALNVLHEVLLKIDTYHVDQPNWYLMIRHGMSTIEVALLQHEPFKRRFLNAASPAKIQFAIDNMHKIVEKATITDRQQAYQIAHRIAEQLKHDISVPPSATLYEFACGAVVSLDPYSGFLTASQYGETMSQIEGNFVGLGVELKTTEDHLEIVEVIPNGPASMKSIKKGDKIVAVANKPVSQLGGEKAADMLRGEQGSEIQISVKEPDGKTRVVTITRQHVEIPSVQAVEIIDSKNGTGYLRLTSFQKTTVRDLDMALWQLHRQGMKRLIVDVRGNPGGLLDTAVDISNRFLMQGRIVSTRGRNPMEDSDRVAQYDGTWQIPLVVIVDENSASASEIFASAIQDQDRGVIVGTTSYGKGSVQGIFALNSAQGGLRLTTAKFYSPNGRAISHAGVIPTVQVHSAAKPSLDKSFDELVGDDTALALAIDVAARQGTH